MKLENMNQEFPKMPDAMRKMIEQEVEQQLQKKTSKFTGRRVMIAALAATLALGTTAFAGHPTSTELYTGYIDWLNKNK